MKNKQKRAKERIRDAFTALNILDVKLKYESDIHPAAPAMLDGEYLRIHIAEEYLDNFAEILETLAEVEGMTDKFISQQTGGMAYTDDEVNEKDDETL